MSKHVIRGASRAAPKAKKDSAEIVITSPITSASNSHEKEIPFALKHFDSLPDAAHVRQPVVEALFGCSSATVWRGVRAGRIPAPTRFAGRITAWNVGELRRTLANV